MIRIELLSYNGAQPAAPLAVDFGTDGGTIGRAEGNTLVLPDPDRMVSRTHAIVAWEDGHFVLLDRGSNPVLQNGRALEPGMAAALNVGDRLQIGGYLLGVTVGAPTESEYPPAATDPSDPFADLLGPGASAAPSPTPPLAADHPLAADRFAEGENSDNSNGPDAFDNWPAPSAFAPPRPGAASPLVADLGTPRGASADLDELFDLGVSVPRSGNPVERVPPDARFGGALSEPLAGPNTAAAADPLQALSKPARVPPAPVPDHVPEWAAAYRVPDARQSLPHAAPSTDADPFAELEAEFAPRDAPPAVASPPAPRAADVDPRPAPVPASPSEPPAVAARTPPVPPAPSAPPFAMSAPVDWLAALADGLGMDAAELPPLTPEFMQRLGVLLREATSGMLDLLMTRAAARRELRAMVTVIEPRQNNPLKLSPSVEVALSHLLGRQQRGYLDAQTAIRDANHDLVAHQIAVMAGMQAALAAVLDRFTPANLEARIARDSLLDTLVPLHRRARLWEQFIALHAQILGEAEDDFHALFGKAFLRAYEEQIDRLRDGPR